MFPTGAALGATGVVPVGAFYWRAAESVALAAAAPRSFTDTSFTDTSFTDTSFTDTERLKAVGLRSLRETASDDHHGSVHELLASSRPNPSTSFKREEHKRWLSPVSR
jgi:hypothetical protein